MNPKELDAVIAAPDLLTFGVSKEMMAKTHFGAIAEVIDRAVEKGKVEALVGRVALLFPEYDADDRAVFEVPEIKTWLHALEERFAFLSVLLDASVAFKILMFTHVPWKRETPGGRKVISDPEATMGFMLESGMTAFRLGKWLGIDAKQLADRHLRGLGLGEILNSDLLDDYQKAYETEEA